jgi:hypothetical protein
MLNMGDKTIYNNELKWVKQVPIKEISIYDASYQQYEKPRYYKNKFEDHGKVSSPVKTMKKNNMAQILLTHNEGLCNFLIFASSCTPYVIKSDTKQIESIKIETFFKSFEKVSAFGIDMSYYETKTSESVNVSYSPTLSSCEIFITDKESVEKIFKEMMEMRDIDVICFYEYESNDRTHFVYSKDNINIISDCSYVKVEFYENKPPHSRLILTDQLGQILNTLKSLNLELSNVDSSSWFSVLWTPFRSSKTLFANTSFLVYYQLRVQVASYDTNYANYSEIPLIGILPIKLDENVWLNKISKSIYF